MDDAKNDKNLISLKEAAKISGYSADYIGQLIRAGKIPGKQVYVNIAWMTTAEAVLGYQKGEASGANEQDQAGGSIWQKMNRKIGMEIQIVRLFFQTIKTAKSIIIILIISFLLLNISIFYFFNHKQTVKNSNPDIKNGTLSY